MSVFAELKALFTGDASQFKAAAGEVENKAGSLQSTLTGVGTAMASAFSVAAVSSAVKGFLDYGASISLAAQNAGILTKEMGGLNDIAARNGMEIEGVQRMFTRLQDELLKAADGSKEAAKKFSALGLDVNDLFAMSPAEQFRAIAKAVTDVNAPLGAVQELFGRLGGGARSFLIEAAKDTKNWSDETANAADEARKLEQQYQSLHDKWSQWGMKTTIIDAGFLGNLFKKETWNIPASESGIGQTNVEDTGGEGMRRRRRGPGWTAPSATTEKGQTSLQAEAARTEAAELSKAIEKREAEIKEVQERHTAARIKIETEGFNEQDKLARTEDERKRNDIHVNLTGGYKADSMARMGGQVGASREGLGIADKQLKEAIETRKYMFKQNELTEKVVHALEALDKPGTQNNGDNTI